MIFNAVAITAGLRFSYSGNFTLNGKAGTPNTEYAIEPTDDFMIAFLGNGVFKVISPPVTTVDIFACGGGGSGGSNGSWATDYKGGMGGNGGCQSTLFDQTINGSGTYTVTIGSGGAASETWGSGHDGETSSISLDGLDIISAAGGTCGIPGGSRGHGVGTGFGGPGQNTMLSASTNGDDGALAFGDTSYSSNKMCAGGGGGGYQQNYGGGAGTGGSYGAGNGGYIYDGGAASWYGSGGGGAAYFEDSTVMYGRHGGAGYQGIALIRNHRE